MSKPLTREKKQQTASDLLVKAGYYLSIREVCKARIYCSVAWGLYNYFEDVEKMTLCTKLLRNIGLSREGIREAQNWGYGWAMDTGGQQMPFEDD